MKGEISVGDMVLMLNASFFEEWNGTIGSVIGMLQYRSPIDLHTMKRDKALYYRVKLGDGRVVNAEPHQVRKIDDEQEAVSESEELSLVH